MSDKQIDREKERKREKQTQRKKERMPGKLMRQLIILYTERKRDKHKNTDG